MVRIRVLDEVLLSVTVLSRNNGLLHIFHFPIFKFCIDNRKCTCFLDYFQSVSKGLLENHCIGSHSVLQRLQQFYHVKYMVGINPLEITIVRYVGIWEWIWYYLFLSTAVSGAHNTIVTARAGKDLMSSLCSGLLTIVSIQHFHELNWIFLIFCSEEVDG